MPDIEGARIDYTGTKVEAMEKLLNDPGPILKRIGAHLVRRSGNAFREQKRGASNWPERMNPNIAGILADCKRGPNVKPRRFQPRPAVVDTGELRRSVAFERVKPDTILYGTTVKYASTQNYGGPVRIKITKEMKRNLWEWMQEEASKRAKKAQRQATPKGPQKPKKARRSKLRRITAKAMASAWKRIRKGLGIKPPKRMGSGISKDAMAAAKRKREEEKRRREEDLRRRVREERGRLSKQLGFLFGMDEYKFKVKARPFIAFDAEDEAEVKKLVRAAFGQPPSTAPA